MVPESDARDQPKAEHQRQHLGAARDAVTEVGAVGDDMHLRHRHRDTAGDAGDREQRLQGVGLQAERAARRRPRAGVRVLDRRGPPQHQASGIIVTMQKMPTPICVARQPSLAMKCCTIGGQMAPAR